MFICLLSSQLTDPAYTLPIQNKKEVQKIIWMNGEEWVIKKV